ncbi:hypothetical protein GYC09_004605 [Salmonella enterica]|nr:hypothetical protein [Salmonella enterica]
MAKIQTRKPVSTLNGLRASVFGATFVLSAALIVGGFLLGNAVAFELPYVVAAGALAVYLVRDLFGIGVMDALFSSDDVIRTKRAAR